jgi:hypothetical protein
MDTIGSVGYYVNGLEYDPVSGKLYGTTTRQDPSFPNGLIEINMSTGFATTIGPAGMHINNPTVNSTGEMFAWSEDDDDLVTVDVATGVATSVGDSGISSRQHGLAFDQDNNLYLVDDDVGDVWSIDASTGAGTLTTTIGTRAHHGDFHPESDLYWGIDEFYGGKMGPNPPERNLLVVDINTAAILDSLSTVDNLHAITFYYDRANLLANGGFETGDLTGWTMVDAPLSAGIFEVVDMASVGVTLAGPSEGTYYAVTDQGDPSTTALLQGFTVPVGDDDVRLSFDMFVFDENNGPIDAGVLDHTGETNQHARVDILTAMAGTFDTGGGVVRNLYLDVDGTTPILPYISYSFDLSGDVAVGQTYWLRFAFSVTEAPIYMGIDDVSITSR